MVTKSFKDLIVWQKAYALTIEIYKVASHFPAVELYGLRQQMCRAAISIPSNIAEGYGRSYRKEYSQFLSIAYGSLCELETQYLLALEFGYLKKTETIELLIKEVGSMLYCMINPRK
ncbi:MAG: four helix bundle protein [Candidatus Omnitrophota bacterium]